MSSHPDTLTTSGNAWYADTGIDNDVVLSSRVRLARNLANFVFPAGACKEDAERIQSLVYDAFSKTEYPDRYQHICLDQLDFSSRQLLAERGILPEKKYSERSLNAPETDIVRKFSGVPGIIVRTDGRLSCLVNAEDHIRIAAFAAGNDITGAWHLCKSIDNDMQKYLQFAASYDFGFLTTSVADSGSGMKISLRLLLPGLVHVDRLQGILPKIQSQHLELVPAYGEVTAPPGALGACYQLNTTGAGTGSEEDQMAECEAAVQVLCGEERAARELFAETRTTMLKHILYRMFAVARYSRFLECSEAIEIVSALYMGVSAGFLSGISYSDLHALLYRIRNAHIDYLRRSSTFMFEPDVKDNIRLMISRLRALLVQESVENVQICI